MYIVVVKFKTILKINLSCQKLEAYLRGAKGHITITKQPETCPCINIQSGYCATISLALQDLTEHTDKQKSCPLKYRISKYFLFLQAKYNYRHSCRGSACQRLPLDCRAVNYRQRHSIGAGVIIHPPGSPPYQFDYPVRHRSKREKEKLLF